MANKIFRFFNSPPNDVVVNGIARFALKQSGEIVRVVIDGGGDIGNGDWLLRCASMYSIAWFTVAEWRLPRAV